MTNKTQPDNQAVDEAGKLIAEAIRSLEFGQVVITVHNSRVVQIEKVEKIRLDRKGSARKPGATDKGGEDGDDRDARSLRVY